MPLRMKILFVTVDLGVLWGLFFILDSHKPKIVPLNQRGIKGGRLLGYNFKLLYPIFN